MTNATPFTYAQEQSAKPSRDWTGYCLVFVRSCFGVGALYPDAATAWRDAKKKHPTTHATSIPRGVPVFWTGGSAGHGHVALSRGDGTVWTTDFVREGKVDVASIDAITAGWGLTLAGWTDDLNGVTVYPALLSGGSAATQKPAPHEVKYVPGPAMKQAKAQLRDVRDANKPGGVVATAVQKALNVLNGIGKKK